MAISDNTRQSLIPNYLYSSSSMNSSLIGKLSNNSSSRLFESTPAVEKKNFAIQAPSEPPFGKIEMYSPSFYAACTAGGILSCGLTHMTVTPLDLVKCNMQIDPVKYKSISSGFGVCLRAEVIADIALCPMEAVKVRVQTQPGFARGLGDGLPKFVRSEGALGLYKGLVPLWGRQIPSRHPYKLQKRVRKPFQLGVSFAGGYVAGVLCAVVSHPADNLVSFLNNAKGASVGDAVKKLGLWGLFTRGLPLRIVMIGTLTGAQWGIYDAFKCFVMGLRPTTRWCCKLYAAIEAAKD
ncbi:mitochondrial phosphate carrier protein 3, mitochondrial [Tanacetum coccineum]